MCPRTKSLSNSIPHLLHLLSLYHQTEQTNHSSQVERHNPTGRNNRTNSTGLTKQPLRYLQTRLNQQSRPNVTSTLDETSSPTRTDIINATNKTDKPNRTNQTHKTNQTDKPNRPAKVDRSGERTGRSAQHACSHKHTGLHKDLSRSHVPHRTKNYSTN